MKAELFSSTTLNTAPWGEQVKHILASAIGAVDPFQAVTRHLKENAEQNDLSKYKRIFVVGAGKAGLPMSQAVADYLGKRIYKGQVTVKEGHNDGISSVGNILILEASHPLPDQRGIKSTKEIINLIQETTQSDLVICLISGGGSALLVSPKEGISLEDLQKLTDQLLASGASIQEINTLRKQLDKVKGGGLAAYASPAEILTLILSDVVGDPLDMIASGPTLPNFHPHSDALAVLVKYNLLQDIPTTILSALKRDNPKIKNSPKNINHILIGNNKMAANAAIKQAKEFGINTKLLSQDLQGEAKEVGCNLAEKLINIETPLPFMWVAGGETTVTLRGNGVGGRNQELALAAVEVLDGNRNLVLISLATDGGDGPTDAAGAVVTNETLSRAKRLNLNPKKFLDNNDSFHFFDPLGDLLKTGPTNTNVNDLVFLFGF